MRGNQTAILALANLVCDKRLRLIKILSGYLYEKERCTQKVRLCRGLEPRITGLESCAKPKLRIA